MPNPGKKGNNGEKTWRRQGEKTGISQEEAGKMLWRTWVEDSDCRRQRKILAKDVEKTG